MKIQEFDFKNFSNSTTIIVWIVLERN